MISNTRTPTPTKITPSEPFYTEPGLQIIEAPSDVDIRPIPVVDFDINSLDD